MKRIYCLVLCLFLFMSLAPGAFADLTQPTEKDVMFANEYFKDKSDDNVTMLFELSLLELRSRGLITEEVFQKIITANDADNVTDSKAINQAEYTFGNGTFIVGLDLNPGTYDITCTAADDESYDSSMDAFSEVYGNLGLGDYSDLFGAMGDLYSSLAGISVTVYDKNGMYDNYYTLDVGKTARIILEDGGKIEISGGEAKLTFIR